jgi:hypothetical protein
MPSRFLVLDEQEEAYLLKPQNGQGGFQTFMRRLQKAYRRASQELPITDDDIDQAQRYAFDYDQGGWENDLKAILARHLGPHLGREDRAAS